METRTFLDAHRAQEFRYSAEPSSPDEYERQRQLQILEMRKATAAYQETVNGRPKSVEIAAPNFDECPPSAGCGPVNRPTKVLSAKPTSSPASALLGRSMLVEECDAAPPPPKRRELMVRYKAQHGPVAQRSRLYRDTSPVLRLARASSAKKVKPATARVGCFPGGSSSIEPYMSCLRSNAVPQTAPPPDLPASMQLLRVALSHLRAVGVLPYVLDVTYGQSFARVTVSPQQLHPDHFAAIPISTVKIYPVVSRVKALSATTRLMRFDGCDRAEESDIVLAFAFDADTVQDNPWEPAFVERECRYRFFTGLLASSDVTSSAPGTIDWNAHRAAINVDASTLVVGGEVPATIDTAGGLYALATKLHLGVSGTRRVPFSREAAELQQPFMAFDACSTDLAGLGFERSFSWLAFTARLNTSIFIAVHRLWYAMRYRQQSNLQAEQQQRQVLPVS